ncbi:hypothetical protein T3H97_14185 [Paenibacillus sp. LX16]|uniref:hypothetical protein n=1 Tax=Paenibacillus sp. LX16 TaxID=1740264 RepID=UPI002E27D57B|nr:hypothetical protein [Paenibacillus sp. LX16]
MKKVSLLASAMLISSVAFAVPSFADQVTSDTYSSLQDSNRSIESVTPFANVEYVVTVNTGSIVDSGTDSNISITLYGSNGDYVTAALTGSFEKEILILQESVPAALVTSEKLPLGLMDLEENQVGELLISK